MKHCAVDDHRSIKRVQDIVMVRNIEPPPVIFRTFALLTCSVYVKDKEKNRIMVQVNRYSILIGFFVDKLNSVTLYY